MTLTRSASNESTGASPQGASISGTGPLFAAYLALLSIEYLGLSQDLPILKALHASTLLAWGLMVVLMLKIGPRMFGEFRQNMLLTGFLLFTLIGVPMAYVQTYAFNALRAQFDYFGFFVMTLYLLDRPSRVRQFAIVTSIMLLVLVGRNLEKLTATSRVAGFKSGFFMGDGNDFAWALAVFLPLALFLFWDKNRLPIRLLGAVAAGAAAFGIIGTQSRGASIALAAVGMYYIAKIAKRKVLSVAAVAIIVVAGLALAPGGYTERMRSISSFESDNSALGRLQAWKAAVNMALDHPLGVGPDNFNTAYGRFYLPGIEDSLVDWGQTRWISPHSIYFRALGEYGVPGIVLLLAIIFTSLGDSQRARAAVVDGKKATDIPEVLPSVAAMSMIAYAVGGVFLGGLSYPHVYIVTGLSASLTRRLTLSPTSGQIATAAPTAIAPARDGFRPRRERMGRRAESARGLVEQGD